ncbi:hypothetical protein Fmac_015970 [Flemingia macrophylla]|uniref:Uncharacterized protein n=1 Tax=Flemingia macrophylla TaxID=520843 RepID=A0ABD1MGP9_9FABA
MFSHDFSILRFLQAHSRVKVIRCMAFKVLLIQNGLLYIFISASGSGTTGLAIVTKIIGWLYDVALHWYATFIMLLAGRLENPVIAVRSYSICLNFIARLVLHDTPWNTYRTPPLGVNGGPEVNEEQRPLRDTDPHQKTSVPRQEQSQKSIQV